MTGPEGHVLWPLTEASRDPLSISGRTVTPGPPMQLSCSQRQTIGPVHIQPNQSAAETQTGFHRRHHPHQSTHYGHCSCRVRVTNTGVRSSIMRVLMKGQATRTTAFTGPSTALTSSTDQWNCYPPGPLDPSTQPVPAVGRTTPFP